MPNILVNKDLCNKCNTCATVCVTGIIMKATDNSYPEVPQAIESNCMKCGHCEAFCPQQALILNLKTEEKIKYESSESKIKAENLALYMKERRSIRHFANKPVDKDIINQVLEVARYAPTGGNAQTVKWLVIYDTNEVKRIAGITIDWFRTIQEPHPFAKYAQYQVAAWDKGIDTITRNAPHLLFAHLPYNEFMDDRTDAIIALSSVDIAAPAFGLGTCWAGFIKMASELYKPMQDALALHDKRRMGYGLMFGYPLYKPVAIPRRNPLDVTWK